MRVKNLYLAFCCATYYALEMTNVFAYIAPSGHMHYDAMHQPQHTAWKNPARQNPAARNLQPYQPFQRNMYQNAMPQYTSPYAYRGPGVQNSRSSYSYCAKQFRQKRYVNQRVGCAVALRCVEEKVYQSEWSRETMNSPYPEQRHNNDQCMERIEDMLVELRFNDELTELFLELVSSFEGNVSSKLEAMLSKLFGIKSRSCRHLFDIKKDIHELLRKHEHEDHNQTMKKLLFKTNEYKTNADLFVKASEGRLHSVNIFHKLTPRISGQVYSQAFGFARGQIDELYNTLKGMHLDVDLSENRTHYMDKLSQIINNTYVLISVFCNDGAHYFKNRFSQVMDNLLEYLDSCYNTIMSGFGEVVDFLKGEKQQLSPEGQEQIKYFWRSRNKNPAKVKKAKKQQVVRHQKSMKNSHRRLGKRLGD